MHKRVLPGRRAHTSLGHTDSEAGSPGGSIRTFSDGDLPEPIYGATSSLPQINKKQSDRSALTQKVKQGLLDPMQYHIYAENYGGVEFYKKLAKKAESTMQLEQKQYLSDLEKNNEMINRLRARISALEATSDEKDTTIENQRRKVRSLRHQLQQNSRSYEKDLTHMRAQVEHLDKRLSMSTDDSKRKLMELKHEVHQKDTALEVFQTDMSEILRSIEEPLESFYLPEYFSKTGQARKSEGFRTAAKILRMRADLSDISDNSKSRDDEMTSLRDEVKSLRKGAEEALRFREMATSSLKTLEGVSEKLVGLDRLITGSPMLRGMDETTLVWEKSPDKTGEVFNKIRAMLELLISKAEGAYKTSNSIQHQQEKCASLLAQFREDLELPKFEKTDDFTTRLATVRQHVRRKLDTLQTLQKEKASAEAAVNRNATKSRHLEKSVDDLNQKQRRVNAEKEKLAESLSQVQKEKAGLEKQFFHLQKSILKLSSAIQAGTCENVLEHIEHRAIKTPAFDEEKEVRAIVMSFDSLVLDKCRLESRIKKGNDQVLELVEMFYKTEKKDDAIREIPSVIVKVVQLRKDIETAASRVKALESELNELGRKEGQMDSMLQQVRDACAELRGSMVKLHRVVGTEPSLGGGGFQAWAELGEVVSELRMLVPKFSDLKKERDMAVSKLIEVEKHGMAERGSLASKLAESEKRSVQECDALASKLVEVEKRSMQEREALTSKLAEIEQRERKGLQEMAFKLADAERKSESLASKLSNVEKKGVEEYGIRQGAEKHLDAIRQSLRAIQSLFPVELGKNSEADELMILEKMKQELLSSKDSKEKAVGKARSLTMQATQLDPILSAILGTLQSIQQNVSGRSSPLPEAKETSGKLEAIRDKLSELQGSITAKVQNVAQDAEPLKEKVKLLEGVLKNSEKKWSDRTELLKKELRRLGGGDIENKVEIAKRLEAAARVRDFLLRAKQPNDATMNPLNKLATFEAQLLVNNKAHCALQVSGTMNGLLQAALHYFRIETQSGDVTFENATVPGSQSSNMLVELLLNSSGPSAAYESKAGDVLGLSVKVTAIDDQAPREILYNSNVIHTDEVMEAIKGQTLDNFSLWPDLVSSWKWERKPSQGWTLTMIKWRFLLKSIFPELSEPLQTLAIANRPTYDRSQTIRML